VRGQAPYVDPHLKKWGSIDPPNPVAPRPLPGTQTKPQVELATSTGVILPETGQFLLCSLQLWQQLQRNVVDKLVQQCKFF